MGAAVSTFIPYDRIVRAFHSSNTTILPLHATPSVPPSIFAGDENCPRSGSSQEDNYKRIAELLQPRSLAIATMLFTLVEQMPTSSADIPPALPMFYFFFLLLAFLSYILSWFFMDKPTRRHVWLVQRAMTIATTSGAVAVILGVYMVLMQSNPFAWYEVVVPVLAVAVISLYLWRGWVKMNSIEPAASAAPTAAATSTAGEV